VADRDSDVSEGFVLDSSVALAWAFEDEANAYADAVLRQLRTARAHVPSIWPVEVANGLLVAERRGRATRAQTVTSVELFESVSVFLDDQTPALALGAILELARAQNLAVYDAAYLELALRMGIPLATLDGRLRAAAAAVGVALYAPAERAE